MTAPPELEHKPRRDEVFRLRIDDLDDKGEGVGSFRALIGPQRAEINFDVHVRRSVPGDLVDFQVSGAKRRRVDGWIREIVQPSQDRIEPRCAHFASDGERPGCGGCSLQLLDVPTQRRTKAERLRRLFDRRGLDPALVEDVSGVGDGWYYRNKMEFSFAGNGDEFGLGMHPGGFKYEVIRHTECLLMSEFVSAFVPEMSSWAASQGEAAYRGDEGFWRSVIIREGKNTGERMVELVTSHHEPLQSPATALVDRFVSWIQDAFPGAATSLYWTQIRAVRGERTQRVEHHLWGRETLREELIVAGRTLSFEIAPSAFFQTNTRGAELLYSMVAEHAAPTGAERVLDLYSGTGTIGLCLAHSAEHVLGIELVDAAVENARANATANGIENVEFVAGDVGEVLAARRPQADVVVIDPPRAGLLTSAHAELARIDAQRLVYVSCNPEALARDLELLAERWQIERVRPVDMFPQTPHVETVVSLVRR